MAYRGVVEDMHKCARLERPGRVPVVCTGEEFDVRVAGVVYEDYCQNAEVMAGVQISAVERMDYDWAWLQVDDCIEFEVLGVGTKGGGNILRATCDYLPATRDTLSRLRQPDPRKDGRMPVLLDAISRIKSHFGDRLCVCGRTAAPLSSVCLLYGLEPAMLLVVDAPQLLRDTMEFFVELQTTFGLAQIEAGADAIWLGDCLASSHMLSPAHYREFAAEPARRVSGAYQKAGALAIMHASEEGGSLPAMAELGFSALSSGPGIDITEAVEVCRGKCCYIGNLDPIGVLGRGTVEQVKKETARLMKVGKSLGGGYIFNMGEMTPRDTPIENMLAAIRAAKSLAEY